MKMKKPQGRVKAVNHQVSKATMITVAASIFIGAMHSQHLYHLFENDRYFSALSSLERDLSFRTEMGLYYSYYKSMVEADSFSQGLNGLLNDNVTEYPSTINTLNRFNLYPEVFLGGAFKLVSHLLKSLEIKSDCYGIERGQGQPPIRTCKGLGEPHYFYIYFIFGLNSLLPVAIFLLSLYLSESLLGGVISVLMFFYNHGEATRVMWTPPLRESFAIPILFIQMLALTLILKCQHLKWSHYLFYGISSLLFLLPWQFAQFALLTQVFCLHAIYGMRWIPAKKFVLLLTTIILMLLVNAVLQFGNVLLMTSYLAVFIPCSLLVVGLQKLFDLLKWPPLIAVSEMCCCVTITVLLKNFVSNLFGVKDDAHISAILLSKFTSYRDFHTQLYTCASEFDFISISYAGKLTLTLLLPVVGVVVSSVLWKALLQILGFGSMVELNHSSELKETHQTETTPHNKRSTETKKKQTKAFTENSSSLSEKPIQCDSDTLEVSILYHCLQCVAFGVMAVLIMRLKVFLTPLMAIIAGLITSRKILPSLPGQYRVSLTYCVIVVSSIRGLWNLSDQMHIIGEYNNPDLEQLVQWINSSTPQDAVFAGSMPIMATVKLTTQRPIVNHPHYEDTNIRARTKLIYTIYSKRDAEIVYSNLRSLQVQYLIVEDAWCNKQYREGCMFQDIYLLEFPEDVDNPVFCHLIRSKQSIPRGFKQVFKNNIYQVLRL